MQTLFACGGVISCVLLYGGLYYITAATIKKTEQWQEAISICHEWPQDEEDVSLVDVEQQTVPCVFPDLARSRGTSQNQAFLAKDILNQAFEACLEEESCDL